MLNSKGKYIGYFIFFTLLSYVLYEFYRFTSYLDIKTECAMDIGPIYGIPINATYKDLKIEQTFKANNERIGFSNLMDNKPPKMFKLSSKNNIIWAVEFRNNDSIGIPFEKLSKMELKKIENGFVFEFFNHSHSEPGKIYVDKNYNLKYLCLKAF